MDFSFSFGIGDEELGLLATGSVLGEDECSLSVFAVIVKQTTYKPVQHGDLV